MNTFNTKQKSLKTKKYETHFKHFFTHGQKLTENKTENKNQSEREKESVCVCVCVCVCEGMCVRLCVCKKVVGKILQER
jgi:hypothetical protein